MVLRQNGSLTKEIMLGWYEGQEGMIRKWRTFMRALETLIHVEKRNDEPFF